MNSIFHTAADLFGIGQQLTTRLGQLLGLVLILFIGAKATHFVARDRPASAVGLVLVALIPAWFVFSPDSATNALKSAIHAIGGDIYAL